LTGQATNSLAVLFNVFAGVERGARVQVVQVIGTWAVAAHIGVCWGTQPSLSALRINPDQSQPKEKEGKTKAALQMLDILSRILLDRRPRL
jgi:hypothetical protein